jgi:hypothetical protein
MISGFGGWLVRHGEKVSVVQQKTGRKIAKHTGIDQMEVSRMQHVAKLTPDISEARYKAGLVDRESRLKVADAKPEDGTNDFH